MNSPAATLGNQVSTPASNTVHCVDCGSANVVDCGPCPLTSAIKGLPDYEKQLITARGAGQLYRCQDCWLGFRFPQVDETELQALYANMPTRRWRYEAQINTAWELARSWLQRNTSDDSSRRLLDVGAFDGIFLNSLGTDWNRFAVEPSSDAVTKLEAMGIPVIDRFLAPPTPEHAGTFDVVTMFDVFEHLRQPGQSLTEALEFLKPGGHLILSTGNCDHWTWSWLRGDHWYCHPLQHLTFGSTRFFQRWATRHNVELVQSTPHPHHPAALTTRCWRSMETVLWGGLRTPGWKAASSLLTRIPGFKYLRHRQTGPYAPELADHLFVVIRKQNS